MRSIGPKDLMVWLADLPGRRRICVDCGSGRGELATFLGHSFDLAVAMDVNPAHLRSLARPARKACARAEALPFSKGSVDLVVSMQALHHFAVEQHLAEARRVLAKGGVFAALSWGEMALPDEIAAAFAEPRRLLDGYWEKQRDWVVAGYPDLAFQGTSIELPATRLSRFVTLDELTHMMAGWSAARRAAAAGVAVPTPRFARGRPDCRFVVSWPIVGQVFRA